MARDQRRLAAIVSADVTGYSRLMGVDESGTLAGLKSHLQAVFNPKIAEYGGRTVKTTGDGLLLEFPSVVDALRCAVDVQRAMAARNATEPRDRRIEFRIGINVGDIIIDGDDIFGDGVNVAARLQALAEPGGICVSKAVRDQVLDKLSFGFEDLGAQRVKNIARPVEAYRVELASDAAPVTSGPAGGWRSRVRLPRARWLGAAVLALVIGGIMLVLEPGFDNGARRVEPPAFSLAIVPFSISGGDQQFADLVVQGIAGALGRTMRFAKVTTVPPSHQTLDTRAIGRESNARYLLQGNVRIESDAAKVAVKLIDADTATQVWAGQFDSERSRWTIGAHDPALLVAREISPALWAAEEARVAHQSPKVSSAPLDLVLRASVLERRRNLHSLTEARALLDEALRQDPNLVLALRERMMINVLLWETEPNADRAKLGSEMEEFARRAVAIDRLDAGVWQDRAGAFSLLWRWNAAFDALDEAERLDPDRRGNVESRTWMLNMTGKPEEAIRLVEQQLQKDPSLNLRPNLRHNQCYALLLLGRFNDAIASCEKSVAGGDDWWPFLFLTVAYAQTGDAARTASSKAELLRRRPAFTIAQLESMGLSDDPVYLKQADANVVSGLRKAGIPEK
jgi:adenylate cyclase